MSMEVPFEASDGSQVLRESGREVQTDDPRRLD